MAERWSADAYWQWWIERGSDEDLPEPIASLVDHVEALRERIDQLPMHDDGCECKAHQCCCAYDRPEDVCLVHHQAATRAKSQEMHGSQ